MKRFLASLALVCLLFTSCKLGCATKDVVVANFPAMIAQTLACKNVANITRDVNAALSKTNLCPAAPPQGPIAMVVCPIAVGAIVSFAGNKIPADWECDPALAEKDVSVALTAACNLIPL
jgi:hypothetical protein